MTLEIADVRSPIGTIRLAVRDGRLCALDFAERWAVQRARLVRRFGRLEFRSTRGPLRVASRLESYFAGALDALARIPVDPGGTPFQRKVWARLRRVPAGQTVSYGELARAVGAAAAARAVGAANGANPIGIVIPCHRVVGAGGGLGGYAGGLARKRWLLTHEGVLPAAERRPARAARG